MADERKYYVLCGDNCKFESMTKEQIIAAIAEATGKTPTDIDSAFISKIKEINKGATVQIWLGTTAEYNALVANGEKRNDVYYVKTDDSALADLQAYFNEALKSIETEIDNKYNAAINTAKQGDNNNLLKIQEVNTVAQNNKTQLASLGKQVNNIDELLESVNANGLIFRRILTADDDLDNILENGIYAYSTASIPKNAPFENAAVIEVVGTDNATSQTIQRAYRYGIAGHSAFRPYYDKKWLVWDYNRIVYDLTWDMSTNEITNGNAVAAQLYADITGGKNVEIRITNGSTFNQVAFAIDRKNGFFSLYLSKMKMLYTWVCKADSISIWNEVNLIETVVEHVVSGNWTYRKWASGIAECWGTVKFALSKDAYEWATGTGIFCASGYGNGSDGSDAIPNIFTSYDCVSIDPIQWYQIGASGRVTAGGTLEVNVFGRTSDMTSLKKGDTVSVNCIVKGKWK